MGNENQSKFYIKKQYCNRRSIRHYRVVKETETKLSYVTFHTQYEQRFNFEVLGKCTINYMLQSGSFIKIAFDVYLK